MEEWDGAEVKYALPVLPLLRAVDEVFRDFLDVFHISAAVGVKEGQPGLDEGAGDLVQAAFVIEGWVPTVELGLWQHEVDQADELLWSESQHTLLCFLLCAHTYKSTRVISAGRGNSVSLQTERVALTWNFLSRVLILLDRSSGHVLAKCVGCGCMPTGNQGLMMGPIWQV